MKLVSAAVAAFAAVRVGRALECEAGYTCWADSRESGLVWVKKNDGNVNGPSCDGVCSVALGQNTDFYKCDDGRDGISSWSELQPIANGMGFNCDASGGCWGLLSPVDGQMLVTRYDDPTKRCYYMDPGEKFNCANNPGNANCYNERYSSICPCKVTELDGACTYDHPPYFPTNPTFAEYGREDGTDCINRINYYRKKACDEGWRECPPSGLPPISECTCCHECANSESAYDKANGAHASFTRCGEMSQGQGGGSNCAAVIDMFVSERYAKTDENGQYICDGHCGPILKDGCWGFHWGKDKDSGFHTLNWRSCNWNQCKSYCDNPYSNACFESDDSIEPNLCGCDDPGKASYPECDDSSNNPPPTPRPTPRPTTKNPTRKPTEQTGGKSGPVLPCPGSGP